MPLIFGVIKIFLISCEYNTQLLLLISCEYNPQWLGCDGEVVVKSEIYGDLLIFVVIGFGSGGRFCHFLATEELY